MNEESVDALFELARRLDVLGKNDEAQAAYIEVLQRSETHFGALHNLGTLLSRKGLQTAARTALTQAVKLHPNNAVAHTKLGMLLMDMGKAVEARAHLNTALLLDPDHLQAHQTMAILLLRLGDDLGARRHGNIGFRSKAEVWPYRGSGEPVRLLVLHSGLGGNVGIERFIDDRVFLKSTVVAEFFDPNVPLPPHEVIFNAIGDADRCRGALEAAERILTHTKAPLINRPDRVLATDRAANAERLAAVPGVVGAKTALLSRAALAADDVIAMLLERGFMWPLLIRTPGFHTGQHFLKLDGPTELPAALASLPGEELLVMEYLDARSPDGKVRKYRVMSIDGKLYPLHVAVSEQWKVHYYTADMADNAAHRAEDAAFLADMAGSLGSGVLATLQRLSDALDLEYSGIDFSVDAAGRVLLFEANATMVVVPPDPDERWAYRREPVARIHEAANGMLVQKARGTTRA